MTTGRMLPLAAAVLLGACHGDSGQAPVAKVAQNAHAAVKPKKGPTPDELTVGMVEAVTVGKSTVPVTVKFDLPARPIVGRSIDVVVAVMPQVAASSIEVRAVGGDGVQLTPAAAAPVDIAAADPAQVYQLKIPLTPTLAGVQLLGLTVSFKEEDELLSRSFSVPLIVAPAAAESTPPVTAVRPPTAGNAVHP